MKWDSAIPKVKLLGRESYGYEINLIFSMISKTLRKTFVRIMTSYSEKVKLNKNDIFRHIRRQGVFLAAIKLYFCITFPELFYF